MIPNLKNFMTQVARAVGRRKEAVAQVQLKPGTGQFLINHKPAQDYLPNNNYTFLTIQEMLRTSVPTMDTVVQVKGGGVMGQAEAIKLGVARAICLAFSKAVLPSSPESASSASGETEAAANVNVDGDVRKSLKLKGFLTQDARVKERRKYGLKKARKAPQYNKR